MEDDEKSTHLVLRLFQGVLQTGLKNLMDKAILSHVKDLSLEYLKDNYTKVVCCLILPGEECR